MQKGRCLPSPVRGWGKTTPFAVRPVIKLEPGVKNGRIGHDETNSIVSIFKTFIATVDLNGQIKHLGKSYKFR